MNPLNTPDIAELTDEEREILDYMLAQERGSAVTIEPRRSEGPVPLSFNQQRIWFIQNMDPDSAAYVIPLAFRIAGELDVGALERSLRTILIRHESLRTRYIEQDGKPVQVADAPTNICLPVTDLAGYDPKRRAQQLRQSLRDEALRPIDIVQGPLLRARLFRLDESEHVLVMGVHHIAADASSIGILLKELSILYDAYTRDEECPLPALPVQYADYSLWQRARLGTTEMEQLLGYWRRQLDGVQTLELVTDRPRPAVQTQSGGLRHLRFPAGLRDGVWQLATQEKATPFMVLLAALAALLARLSGQSEVSIGSPVANRSLPELESLIGLFVNMIVLRNDVSGDQGFRELLSRVRSTALDAYAHHELPFEKLVEALNPRRDRSLSPLFQITLVLHELPSQPDSADSPLFEKLPRETVSTHFDIEFELFATQRDLAVALTYNTDLFDDATMDRMLSQYQRVLEAVVADPDMPVWAIDLMGPTEHLAYLERSAGPIVEHKGDVTVVERIRAVTTRNPEGLALACDGCMLTYADLDHASNRIANRLLTLGATADIPVAVLLDRSPEMIVAWLAVLKAGAGYLPLDPEYPSARLEYMLKDSAAPVLITVGGLAKRVPAYTGKQVLVDEDTVLPGGVDDAAPDVHPRATDLAYLIYTSGSTGVPKGVAVEHRALSNLVGWHNRAYQVSVADRATQVAGLGFDACVWEVWPYLAAGASVHLVDAETRLEPGAMWRWLADNRITHTFIPTPMAEAMLREPIPGMLALRVLLTGGDRLHGGLPAVLPFRLINHYGPTENAVVSISSDVDLVRAAQRTPAIGRPIDNVQAYVLDEHLQPVPEGVVGELYLGGASLARGYWCREDLTRDKFVDNPFADSTGSRLYRTGDLVRCDATGTLHFVGRTDHQVKVRGHRIELGEVEQALLEHALVREAAAAVREDAPGERQLVAYVVADREVGVAALREHLQARLPGYMVPSMVVQLDALPLTPNGKVDLDKLPAPAGAREGQEYSAPRGELEQRVAAVWSAALRVARVGRDDNFFELGGHSLIATQVISRMRSSLGIEVTLKQLFATPTVSGVVRAVEDCADSHWVPPAGGSALIPVVARDGKLPLSFGQERLWFLAQLDPKSTAYTVPMSLHLAGDLDVDALSRTLQEIVRRHEVLRTTFRSSEGEAVQVIHPVERIDFPMVDLSGCEEHERNAVLGAPDFEPFDLQEGPLLRCRLYRISPASHVLRLSMHHIAADGWSVQVMFREITALYPAFLRGDDSPLPELHIQYADFAHWQRHTLAGGVLDRQLQYWRGQLAGHEPLALPLDHRRPAVQTFTGARHTIPVPAAIAVGVRSLARRVGTTPFVTLLGGFMILLHRLSGQSDVVLGTPIANRTRREIEGLIGYFANTLVMRGDLSGNPSLEGFVARLNGVALDAYANQELPFERLVEALGVERDPARNPLIQVVFTYLSGSRTSLQIGDLEMSTLPIESTVVRFDLECNVLDAAGEMKIQLIYNTALYERATAERWLALYLRVIEAMVTAPEAGVSDFQLLTGAGRQRLLCDWNATSTPYPRDASVVSLFREQAARRGDATALVFGETRMSYAELDRRSDAMCRRLRARGVEPGELVAVCVERSPEMVIGILGILKSGAAYVPLDPEYPLERLAYMFEDAGARVLVSSPGVCDALETRVEHVLHPGDDEGVDEVGDEVAIPADALAYVMYTSGSTGTPKGVCVEHRSVVRLVRGANFADLGEEEVFLQLAPISFDASTLELWGSLLNGGHLVVAPPGALSLAEIGKLLQRERVSVLWLTAALFNRMVDAELDALSGVRQVLTGGEVMSAAHARRFLDRIGESGRLVNAYGPTENTTFTCCHVMRAGDEPGAPVPIGRPISNTRVYVLDAGGQPVPEGVVGELYAAGDGLARGYLNQPSLTSEKFIASRLEEQPGERLYRTGDLVRWRDGGVLEFVGRVDSQVKIRGYRIELGEIESVLGAHASVSEAVVCCLDDASGDKRLVAYVVAAPAATLSVSVIRDYLRGRLPEYMLPQSWVVLPELPVTAVGKVDRDALPAPAGKPLIGESYEAPDSELESVISEAWCEVLGLERVGVNDNFFDLGGHSLLVLQVHAKLERLLHRNVPVVRLFQYPTVGGLARHIGDETPGHALRDEARARVSKLAKGDAHGNAVAIVGMVGRLPGARDLEAFWDNLAAGIESIRFFTEEELRTAGVPASVIHDPRYVPARGVLDDADMFDASFFGYPPREAELIDPQQRLFLECAHEALEDAGYDSERFDGLVGVYAGCSASAYLFTLLSRPDLNTGGGFLTLALGNQGEFLPTRVSYKLNLRGPSMNVQTACSTSLVAVHAACRALLGRECDMALAGGASVTSPRVGGYAYVEQGIMSPDGHCRTFDADARGTVAGEGVGVMVLKRLEDALLDRDTIHAVIRGTAINNDGSDKVGFTAPAVSTQAAVIALAQAVADVEPDSVSYIEAHGTATALGDPIEVEALNMVFGNDNRAAGSCVIGAVKSNIGHLDAAAGMAGLMKTVLALEHRQIPPSLHFKQSNPKINFEAGPFRVNTELRPWPGSDTRPRRAGVSGFGIGGTNAHVVLEEAPGCEPSGESREHQLLVLSARNADALNAAAARLHAHLSRSPAPKLADVAFTLQVGRREFGERRAIVCRDREGALAALEDSSHAASTSQRAATEPPPVVFMFPGQGTQYPNMGLELHRSEPVFREAFDRCISAFEAELGVALGEMLHPEAAREAWSAEALKRTVHTQPALFATEYALAVLLQDWGIRPHAMIGHSIGELVAACVAGALSPDAAIKLVVERARAMEETPEGAMVAVQLAEAEAARYLDDGLWLAAVNAPSACVLSGTVDAVEALQDRLDQNDVGYQRLHTTRAFHSGLMDKALDRIAQAASDIEIAVPHLRFISNVSGDWIAEADLRDPAYWARHVREPVRFAQGLKTLLGELEECVILEVGPGSGLGSLARQSAGGGRRVRPIACLPGPRREMSSTEMVTRAVGSAWVAGVGIDWERYHAGECRSRVRLPTYPFQRKRFWADPRPARKAPGAPAVKSERMPDIADWFYVSTWHGGPTPMPCTDEQLAGQWLLFADSAGIARALARRLESAGAGVTLVEAGEQCRLDAQGFTLRPGTPGDYDALVARLEIENRMPGRVVHLWGVTGSDDPVGSAIERCYHSPLLLAQALGRQGVDTPMAWSLVTTGRLRVLGDELIAPAKSTLMGPCLVLPAEYPNIRCRGIDLRSIETAMAASDCDVDTLLAEIVGGQRDPQVAYRNGQRWTQAYSPVPLPRNSVPLPRLRERGVYLITGGLGGMALEIAKELARTVSARLVLVARNALPAREQWDEYLAEHEVGDRTRRRIEAVREIEALGAEVVLETADICDRARMTAVVSAARQRFGAIHGIFHTAGVAGAGVIQLKSRESSDDVLAPKVMGTLLLAELVQDLAPDFMLLCSSMTSLVGAPGQVDYTAANSFLDAYAVAAPVGDGAMQVVSVNWPTWREVGMAVETEMPDSMEARRARSFELGLDPGEGIEVLRRLLGVRWPQVAVSPHPFGTRAETLLVGMLHPETSSMASRAQAVHVKHPDLSRWFYAPIWRQGNLSRRAAARRKPRRWLIHCDGQGLGDAIANIAESSGDEVVLVRPGETYLAAGDGRYDLVPSSAEDHNRVVAELAAQNWRPDVLVHLGAVLPGDAAQDDGAVIDTAFFPVLHAIRALASVAGMMPLRVEVITARACDVHGGEPTCRAIATLSGICRVLPQEFPGTSARLVDVRGDDVSNLARQLARELNSPSSDGMVAYRDGRRWVQDFEQIVLDAPEERDLPLRDGGVYLITGGLGSLGMTLADHLARSCKAKLVLTARTALPPRDDWDGALDDRARAQVRAIRRLEAAGAEVMTAAVDVTDETAMAALVNDILARFGAINGVIHAAGVLSGEGVRPIVNLDREACLHLFAPKIRGAVVLDRVLAAHALDFRLLMSSLAAVLGGLGHTAYAAANAFLDAFAATPGATMQGAPWLSVDWESWNIGGAADRAGGSVARFAMTAGEGVEAFRRVLAVKDLPQVVVSTGSLDARLAMWTLPEESDQAERGDEDEAGATTGGYERPELDQEYVAPRTETERDIARIWGELLGINGIGIHDDFLDLGGHSLMATRMLARLRNELKLDLTLEDVLTDMTVARVAARADAGGSVPEETIQEDAPQDLLASIYTSADGGNRVGYRDD